MKVGIFYTSFSKSQTPSNKDAVMGAFAQGVRACGDQVIEIREKSEIPDVDIGLVLGYTLSNNYRGRIIETLRARGSRIVFIDSNIFSYKIKNVDYHRYSLDTVYPSTGTYFFNKELDLQKWPIISKYHKLELKPWRQQGNHILVLAQRTLSWNMLGKDGNEWTIDIIKRLKHFTLRPIIVRLHPGDTKYNDINSKKIKDVFGGSVTISSKKNIEDDLKNAWISVGYNSTPNCVSAIEGVPVYLDTPLDSWAKDVAFTDLSMIENPSMPDRTQWIHRLSNIHWKNDEVAEGKLFFNIKNYICSFQK